MITLILFVYAYRRPTHVIGRCHLISRTRCCDDRLVCWLLVVAVSTDAFRQYRAVPRASSTPLRAFPTATSAAMLRPLPLPPPTPPATISVSKQLRVCCPMTQDNSMVCSKKVLCPQNRFRENCKDTKGVCSITWTYDICAFDTGTYCAYYWQNHDVALMERCKQNMHFRRITGNKYSTLYCHKEVT